MNRFFKENIEEIKKDPGKIFGLVYPYLLLIGLALGLFYVSKLNFIGRQQVPPPLPDTTKAPVELTIREARTVPTVDIMKLAQPSDSLIQMGKNIFETTCTVCHGKDGKGDGPASTGLIPSPRNFTSKGNWINGPTLSGIYQTLQEGIKGSAMAPYGQFSPTEKFALAHYIRTTFVPNPPETTKEDLEMLDRVYNLSKGRYIPGQIPVSDAEKLIIRENKGKINKLTGLMEKISRDVDNSGAKLFKEVTNNKFRALTILLNSDTWKNNEQEFIKVIVNNVNQDGFNVRVLNLSGNEWDILYNYMKAVFV
jgi:mono/diheme cytochrome c family protein